MPKKKSELSITKRVLLDYIQFRTNNNFTFYEGNEYIAKALGLTTGSAKVFVNDLIREGYLYKETDRQGRRVLSYTGKTYFPLFEDMRNIDKKVLKLERDGALNENQYLQEQLTFSEGRVNSLVSEKTDLTLTNEELTRKVKELEERITKLENRTTKLENLFYKNGISQEQLEKAIQDNEKKD